MLPKALLELLDTGISFAGPDGYWRKEGYKENPGLANLEFADFFEPVWRPDHKKSFLDTEGNFKLNKKGEESIMHGRVGSLLDLYNGLALTPRVIGQAFFMYSAGCVNWHLHALRLSRKGKCDPDLASILRCNQISKEEKDMIKKRSQALSVCAFTLYEGSGALGGYNAKQWNFWGRIWGMETPLQMGSEFLSAADAGAACAEFNNAETHEKKALFKRWLPLGYPNLPEGVDDMLWTYYSWVELYQSFEAGFEEPEEDDGNHMGAVLAGFVRRAAKGYLVAPKYDIHKAFASEPGFGTPVPLVEYMLDHEEEISQLLQSHTGLSAFGQWVVRIISAQSDRCEIVEDIVARGEVAMQNSETAKRMAKEGLAYRMSQRGKTRFNRIR